MSQPEMVGERRSHSGRRPLSWIEIGSDAKLTAPIPSAALRAARLQIVGSGQGSVSTADILAELPALADEITRGRFADGARPVPLADVEQAWADAIPRAQRIVLIPEAVATSRARRDQQGPVATSR